MQRLLTAPRVVVLTTDEERDVLDARARRRRCSALPDDALKIVMRGPTRKMSQRGLTFSSQGAPDSTCFHQRRHWLYLAIQRI